MIANLHPEQRQKEVYIQLHLVFNDYVELLLLFIPVIMHTLLQLLNKKFLMHFEK